MALIGQSWISDGISVGCQVNCESGLFMPTLRLDFRITNKSKQTIQLFSPLIVRAYLRAGGREIGLGHESDGVSSMVDGMYGGGIDPGQEHFYSVEFRLGFDGVSIIEKARETPDTDVNLLIKGTINSIKEGIPRIMGFTGITINIPSSVWIKWMNNWGVSDLKPIYVSPKTFERLQEFMRRAGPKADYDWVLNDLMTMAQPKDLNNPDH